MGIYVKFTMTTHQMWSCHVNLASNSENFYFSPNSILNFRKKYQMWGTLAQEQKNDTGKNKTWGGKHPPPQVLIGLIKAGVKLYSIAGVTLLFCPTTSLFLLSKAEINYV